MYHLAAGHKQFRLSCQKVSLFQPVLHAFPELCLNGISLFCKPVSFIQKYQSVFCREIVQKSHGIFIKVSYKMLRSRKILILLQTINSLFHHMGKSGSFFRKKILPEFLYHGLLFFFYGLQAPFQNVLIQDHLCGRVYSNFFQIFYRSLTFRIKTADGINLIPPQFYPHRIIQGQREDINDAAPDRKLSRGLCLGSSFISHAQKLLPQFFQVYRAVVFKDQGMLSYNLQRKEIVHTPSHTGDHSHTFIFQEGSHSPHSFSCKKISMHICLEKDQILGRIKEDFLVIHPVVFIDFSCLQIILRNDQAIQIFFFYIIFHTTKKPIHHMGFL